MSLQVDRGGASVSEHMCCSCCGADTIGRQWSNRDTGYGVCVVCADCQDNAARFEEPHPEEGLREHLIVGVSLLLFAWSTVIATAVFNAA